MTHTQRWHSEHKTIGSGHLYQGRYKSFPIQINKYLFQLFRYVERNALRGKLVKKAEDWKWSSLYRSDGWVDKVIERFDLKATLRNPGRPNKGS